jgi:hypothetical protein
VEGPGVGGAVPLAVRARAVFEYFNKYNYEVWRDWAASPCTLLAAHSLQYDWATHVPLDGFNVFHFPETIR